MFPLRYGGRKNGMFPPKKSQKAFYLQGFYTKKKYLFIFLKVLSAPFFLLYRVFIQSHKYSSTVTAKRQSYIIFQT